MAGRVQVSRKGDYRFVAQRAMRRIAVEGKPYPVRDQKLVPLGEDVAYLEEAIRERRLFMDEMPGIGRMSADFNVDYETYTDDYGGIKPPALMNPAVGGGGNADGGG